jgi:hypothetical protein
MECLRTPYVVPCHGLDATRPRGRECFIPGNFKKDATVRPSHGRPHGHRPIVRPSVIVRLTTLCFPDLPSQTMVWSADVDAKRPSVL